MKRIIVTLFLLFLPLFQYSQEIIDFKNFEKSETEDYYIGEWMGKYRILHIYECSAALETDYTYLGKKAARKDFRELRKKLKNLSQEEKKISKNVYEYRFSSYLVTLSIVDDCIVWIDFDG